MLKDKIKNFLNKEEGDNKKKIENLAVFVVILIVTLVIINLIWSGDTNNKEDTSNDPNKKLATVDGNDTTINTNATAQNTLSLQLEKIDGVGNVNVLITYSQTNEIIPMYNEDTSQKDTEETDTNGGTRKIIETDTKKEIIYQEDNGEKTPITQSIISPKIEGAIITAQGASDATVKANIIQAVEAVTGLSSHKIQVFTMTGDGSYSPS